MLTYVACACASLLSSSAASPLTWLNVLLSASRCCCHCIGGAEEPSWGKTGKVFFLFFFAMPLFQLRFGRVDMTRGGGRGDANGRGERSQS